MADEPSNSELWRLITDVRADLTAQFKLLVLREVYDAREAARDRDMAALQKDVDEERREREKAEEQRAADRRLIFTSLVAPVLMLALMIWLASRGVHS